MNYILTIDIGNTRAKYAVFEGEKIVDSSVFNPYKKDDLKKILLQYPQITKGILSSVGGKEKECLNQLKGIDMIVLSSQTPLPFKSGYKNKKIGSDRLMSVAGALMLKPQQNNLVIDIGSCITYDILTKDNIHLAGPISPGVSMRFKSMNEYTKKLPLLSPNHCKLKYICNSTEESLQSGVLRGIEFEIKGFIDYYSHIYNDLNVFITGGDNIFFEKKLKNCIFADLNFAFNGLSYILNYNEIL